MFFFVLCYLFEKKTRQFRYSWNSMIESNSMATIQNYSRRDMLGSDGSQEGIISFPAN